MFIVRSEIVEAHRSVRPWSPLPTSSLILQAIDEPGTGVRLDSFLRRDDARLTGGELYQLRFGVMGALALPPAYAVCVEWDLASPTHADSFEWTHQQLAELRRELLPTLIFDWLLKRLDRQGQYLALSLYADDAGLRLGQTHPEIRRFAEQHSPASFTATELSGARYYRVARSDQA